MTHTERINQIRWLTTWGKWCRKQYLSVESHRKDLYKQVMEDTRQMLNNLEDYHGEEKEYDLDESLWVKVA